MSLGHPACFISFHPWTSPCTQSGSFSHTIRWKTRQILLFSFFQSLSFSSQHTVQWKDERKAGTSKIQFQGGFYQCQTSVPCYWLHTVNFYFPSCVGTWYQNSLLATEGRCLLLVHGQRKKEVLSLLGYFPNQSVADEVLCPLMVGVEEGGLIPHFCDL